MKKSLFLLLCAVIATTSIAAETSVSKKIAAKKAALKSLRTQVLNASVNSNFECRNICGKDCKCTTEK